MSAAKLVEGTLGKLGRITSSWVPRHMVLLQNGLLISCKKNGDGDIVKFKQKASLSSETTFQITHWGGEDDPTFQIIAGRDAKPIHLKAESEEARGRWLTALRQVCQDVSLPLLEAHIDLDTDGSFRITGGHAPEGRSRTPSIVNNTYPKLTFSPYAVPGEHLAARAGIWETVKHRVIHALASSLRGGGGGYAMLIVDEPATKAISAIFGVSDLVDLGILTVEALERSREPLEGMDVIYFIDPDHVYTPGAGGGKRGLGLRRAQNNVALTSLQRVAADFDQPYRRSPRYTDCSVTVLLLSRPTLTADASFTLQSATNLWSAMRRQAPRYLSSGFEIVQSRVFTFNEPKLLERVLTNSADDEQMNALAVKIAEACYAMNEYPYIRYKLSSPQSTRLANMVQIELDKLLRDSGSYHFYGEADVANRSTLIILMRQDDLASPLIHDFNFQALVRDVLKDEIDQERDCIRYTVDVGTKGESKPVEKMFFLNSKDALWARHRHDHLVDVINDSYALVQKAKKGEAANLGNNSDMHDLSAGIANLNSEVELRQKAGQLQRICTLAMAQVNSRGLLKQQGEDGAEADGLAELEQQMICGVTAEGREVHQQRMLERVVQVLETCKMQDDAYRLVALNAVACDHFDDASQRDLIFSAATLDQTQEETVMGLRKVRTFNHQLEVAIDEGRFLQEQQKKVVERARAAKNAESVRDELLRTKSVAYQLAEECINGGLCDDMFPYTRKPPPGARLSDLVASIAGRSGRTVRESVRNRGKSRRTQAQARRRRRGGPGGAAEAKGSEGGGDEIKRSDSASLQTKDTVNRLIVFMAGGVSYSEIQQLHELGESHNIDVVVGSTDVLTPSEYMRHIEEGRLNEHY